MAATDWNLSFLSCNLKHLTGTKVPFCVSSHDFCMRVGKDTKTQGQSLNKKNFNENGQKSEL